MDTVLINPDAKALAKLLPRAVKAANRKVAATRQVSLTEAIVKKLVASVLKSPEGHQYWRRGRRSFERRAVLAVAWWTDSIGRKHVRVAGEPTAEIAPVYQDDPAGCPPVGHVYPQFCVKRGIAGDDYVMVCGCGAVGSDASIAWMGEHCGPCHDRLEEGGAIPPPPVFTGRGVAITPDGRAVLYCANEELVYQYLAAGETRRVACQEEEIVSAAFHPSRPECWVNHGGGRTRWNWETGKATHKELLEWDNSQSSPDGRWTMNLFGEYSAINWDRRGDPVSGGGQLPRLFAQDPLSPGYRHPVYVSGAFAPDDGRWIGLTQKGRVDAVDLATLTATVLRAEAIGAGNPFVDVPGARPHVLDAHWASNQLLVIFFDEDYNVHGPVLRTAIRGDGDWVPVPGALADPELVPEVARFTPDGRWVVMPGEVGTNAIWFCPLDGGERRELEFGTQTQQESLRSVVFSPDGEWLYATMLIDDDFMLPGRVRRLPWRTLLGV